MRLRRVCLMRWALDGGSVPAWKAPNGGSAKNHALNGALSALANLCSQAFPKQPRHFRGVLANPIRFRRGKAETERLPHSSLGAKNG